MKNRRWLVVVLMFFSAMLGYLDRTAIGIAGPMIAEHLSLDAAQMGWVYSAFFFGYAAFAFIGGRAADRFGPKRMIVGCMVFWSVFCGLTAVASTFAVLVAVRFLFGVGEGPYLPSQVKLVGRWFPRKEQATTIGLYGAGETLGGALAGPLVAFLTVAVSWQFSFITIGTAGVLLAVIWLLFMTEWPEQSRLIGEEERRFIVENRSSEVAAQSTSGSFLSHCFSAPILATALAWFGFGYVIFFFMTWFPSYLTTTYGLSLKEMGFMTSLPWIFAVVGRVSSGYLSDRIYQRTGDALFARKVVLCTGLGVAAVCIALAGFATTIVAVMTLTCISLMFLWATANIYWALTLDLVPQDQVGGVGGFGLFAGGSAGIVAPIITGYLIQWTGIYTSAFVLAGVIAIIGALAVLVLVRRPPAGKLVVAAA